MLGNDLSPTQPRWVPPNVHFEIDDVEAPWTYSSKFDFIHCRCMGNAIRDWPNLVQQSFECVPLMPPHLAGLERDWYPRTLLTSPQVPQSRAVCRVRRL